METQNWKDKVSNPAQVGGIETSILDNGSGKGTRIAWINTGTGLRYKVVLDRSMDIADAFYNQHSLVWLSHGGITTPTNANKGIDWLKSFGGGLVTTCGLTHVGGPEEDEFGNRGLHGRISNTPAEIESIIQPDPANGKLEMSITGTMKQTEVFGSRMELRRTISSVLGQSAIKIKDVVINKGNTPSPHMLLYHINFGWPLVDEGTKLLWNGECKSRGMDMDNDTFHEGNDFKTCPNVLKTHDGYGEAAGFVNINEDEKGMSQCGLYNAKLSLAVSIRYPKKQMPWMTNWQHFGAKEYVTALEPGTNPPIGQTAARKQETLIFLKPEESRNYDLDIDVMADKSLILDFINKNQLT